MRSIKLAMLLAVTVLSFSAQLIFAGQEQTLEKILYPIELKGIKALKVEVYITEAIPDFQKIENEVRKLAEKWLTRSGIAVVNTQGTRLVISADLYNFYDISRAEFALVELCVEIYEPVMLTRNPSIMPPRGARTWSRSSASYERWPALDSFIIEQAFDWLEYLCQALKSANDKGP